MGVQSKGASRHPRPPPVDPRLSTSGWGCPQAARRLLPVRRPRWNLRGVQIHPAFADPVGLVRAARRRADCSQRELAERAGVSHSTVARIESAALVPSLTMLRRLLAVAELQLVAVDPAGRLVLPMGDDRDDLRDGAERRYPTHLDTILDPPPGEWWADRYGLTSPPETFHRDRGLRDARRRRSKWEVRVAQHRHLPPPPGGRQAPGHYRRPP